jgi:hypothetical protein
VRVRLPLGDRKPPSHPRDQESPDLRWNPNPRSSDSRGCPRRSCGPRLARGTCVGRRNAGVGPRRRPAAIRLTRTISAGPGWHGLGVATWARGRSVASPSGLDPEGDDPSPPIGPGRRDVGKGRRDTQSPPTCSLRATTPGRDPAGAAPIATQPTERSGVARWARGDGAWPRSGRCWPRRRLRGPGIAGL